MKGKADPMQTFKQAQCPYCGRKIGLLKCWVLKTEGEYRCPKCGGYSNIVLNPILISFAMICIIISTAIFLVQILLIRTFSWLIFTLVFLPFFIFFFSSVFLVQFKKPASRRRPPEERRDFRIEPPESQRSGYRIEPPDSRYRNRGERTVVSNYTRKL
jgi:predicted RNA-binding Zn-ribbon protein involved in translation (DUF1610 family)